MYNNLTDAQAERLFMLAEEAAEVVQIVNKILRHGYDSYHPEDLHQTPNRIELEREMTDLASIHWAMVRAGDLTGSLSGPQLGAAWNRKLRYAHHQPTR